MITESEFMKKYRPFRLKEIRKAEANGDIIGYLVKWNETTCIPGEVRYRTRTETKRVRGYDSHYNTIYANVEVPTVSSYRTEDKYEKHEQSCTYKTLDDALLRVKAAIANHERAAVWAIIDDDKQTDLSIMYGELFFRCTQQKAAITASVHYIEGRRAEALDCLYESAFAEMIDYEYTKDRYESYKGYNIAPVENPPYQDSRSFIPYKFHRKIRQSDVINDSDKEAIDYLLGRALWMTSTYQETSSGRHDCLDRAYALNYPDAVTDMGILNAYGKLDNLTGPVDEGKGLELLEKAAESGNDRSLYYLLKYHFDHGDYRRVINTFIEKSKVAADDDLVGPAVLSIDWLAVDYLFPKDHKPYDHRWIRDQIIHSICCQDLKYLLAKRMMEHRKYDPVAVAELLDSASSAGYKPATELRRDPTLEKKLKKPIKRGEYRRP